MLTNTMITAHTPLLPAADGAIVAEEVDDREHQEPDLDDRQGDDQQQDLRREALEPVDRHGPSIASRGRRRHGDVARIGRAGGPAREGRHDRLGATRPPRRAGSRAARRSTE